MTNQIEVERQKIAESPLFTSNEQSLAVLQNEAPYYINELTRQLEAVEHGGGIAIVRDARSVDGRIIWRVNTGGTVEIAPNGEALIYTDKPYYVSARALKNGELLDVTDIVRLDNDISIHIQSDDDVHVYSKIDKDTSTITIYDVYRNSGIAIPKEVYVFFVLPDHTNYMETPFLHISITDGVDVIHTGYNGTDWGRQYLKRIPLDEHISGSTMTYEIPLDLTDLPEAKGKSQVTIKLPQRIESPAFFLRMLDPENLQQNPETLDALVAEFERLVPEFLSK